MNVLPKSEEGRFWAKVDVGHPLGCWEWTAYTEQGYGRFRSGASMVRAHRWAFEFFHGPLPEDSKGVRRVRELDHLCSNTLCVNPDHLELVTHLENVRRGDGNGNASKTHCKHGHEYTEGNTYRHPRGQRVCRTCAAASQRRWYASRR